MSDEFLPRAHSKRLGELERSNWKSLRDGRNFDRIDPGVREIVSLLNGKGYRTFSSCSGGHPTNPRWKVNRHESGYLAFSPPSSVAFTLYLGLRKKNRDFTVEAQAVIDDGDGGDRETVCTRFYWQLSDKKKHRLEYYRRLFGQMRNLIEDLPRASRDRNEVLTGLFSKEYLPTGLRIVRSQMRRFTSS
jgi:hypothetical protein